MAAAAAGRVVVRLVVPPEARTGVRLVAVLLAAGVLFAWRVAAVPELRKLLAWRVVGVAEAVVRLAPLRTAAVLPVRCPPKERLPACAGCRRVDGALAPRPTPLG